MADKDDLKLEVIRIAAQVARQETTEKRGATGKEKHREFTRAFKHVYDDMMKTVGL